MSNQMHFIEIVESMSWAIDHMRQVEETEDLDKSTLGLLVNAAEAIHDYFLARIEGVDAVAPSE